MYKRQPQHGQAHACAGGQPGKQAAKGDGPLHIPVSYTHLDVYKRQAPALVVVAGDVHELGRHPQGAALIIHKVLGARHAPVSYTHLDVYKRQVLTPPKDLAITATLYIAVCVTAPHLFLPLFSLWQLLIHGVKQPHQKLFVVHFFYQQHFFGTLIG